MPAASVIGERGYGGTVMACRSSASCLFGGSQCHFSGVEMQRGKDMPRQAETLGAKCVKAAGMGNIVVQTREKFGIASASCARTVRPT